MNLLSNILNIPRALILRPWAWLWGWTYPLAKPVINEVTLIDEPASLLNVVETARLVVQLPFIARSQQFAERSAATRSTLPVTDKKSGQAYASHVARWQNEPLWRSHFREALVWATIASWLIGWSSVGFSMIFTGNFLFEVHESPDLPGYVSNYFKVAALAFLLPITWTAGGIATLTATRQKA